MKVKHLKTGNIYRILGIGTDCTNSRDGVKTVIYISVSNPLQIFVREFEEFMKKFEYIQDNNIKHYSLKEVLSRNVLDSSLAVICENCNNEHIVPIYCEVCNGEYKLIDKT